ncbi:MAG: hypothetical protein WCF65_05990 [Parachlamydiaceae bacterium]
MTAYAGVPTRHVNTYHCNNSLIFQFVLSEFIESFSTIQQLNSYCCNPNSASLGDAISFSTAISHRQEIGTCLTKLLGSSNGHIHLFSWNFSEGILSKLKTYCALLLQNSDNDEKELIALQHYAEKIWLGCLQIGEALNSTPFEAGPLTAAVEKASSSMIRFSKLIARLISQFRDDENVIFYVVRNHKILDKLYGNRFVFKLLGRLYTKGMHEVQHVLSVKYSARGFDDLLPAIRSHIAEIEAAAL